MNILVTGVAGFIGSAVAERLVSEGYTVIGVDNFNEYYDLTLKRARQKQLLSGVEIIEADIRDKAAMDELFTTDHFDVVAHLAAQAGVRYSVEHPEVYVQTNVLGTQILLECMHQHRVGRLVFASTSSVYGTNSSTPFKEDMPADRPVSMYAATKRAGELMAHSYYSLYGIEATCLRFFTVYGPWSRPDMAMLKFAALMTAGKPIDIYNKGNLKRDFTYIDDIVTGFVAAVEKPLGYEIINLGNGRPIQLLDYIAALEEALGIEAEKNWLPMQPGDVFETYADITKAGELLDFEPQTDLQTGISNFVNWYQQYYQK